MEDNKTMAVLEMEGCDYRLYKSFDKAKLQMIEDWFNYSAKESLEKALALLNKIGEGTNDPYDLETVKQTVRFIKTDLQEALRDSYIDSYAWISTAEVMD